MSINHLVNKITKPVSDINFNKVHQYLEKTFSEHPPYRPYGDSYNTPYNAPHKINLFQFLRMYKIGGIPIIDFVSIYVLLYIINKVYINANYKIVFLASIAITIFVDAVMITGIYTSKLMLLIFVLSVFYIIKMERNNIISHISY
jgi:hypothetical protein